MTPVQKQTASSSRSKTLALVGKGAFREALEQYGPGSASRRRIAEYRFENLGRNIVPVHLRILSWTVNQHNLDKPNWDRFINRLRLSGDNRNRFLQVIQSKSGTSEDCIMERLRIEQTYQELALLRKRYAECAAQISRQQSRISNILTPNQAAMYFAFVERRRAALGSLIRGGPVEKGAV